MIALIKYNNVNNKEENIDTNAQNSPSQASAVCKP